MLREAILPLVLVIVVSGCARAGDEPQPVGHGSDAKSCVGHCGDGSSDGTCFCDESCHDLGDCCADYTNACSSAGGGGTSSQTASGGAAGAAPSGGAAGASAAPGPGCSPALCNTQSPGKTGTKDCYCDSTCIVYGDCCANKVDVCGP